jgi:hypothetical protein
VQLRQQLTRRVRAQFGRPTGLPGPIAGWVMTHRSSNRRSNARAVSLLDARRNDRVLEIGFGPGVAIRELARLAAGDYACRLEPLGGHAATSRVLRNGGRIAIALQPRGPGATDEAATRTRRGGAITHDARRCDRQDV